MQQKPLPLIKTPAHARAHARAPLKKGNELILRIDFVLKKEGGTGMGRGLVKGGAIARAAIYL